MRQEHRIHYLDNLRAIAMLLGLILHAGVFSGTLDVSIWRVHDSSEFIFWIVAFIHFFRMQLFFLLSGFFSSLVVEKTGVKEFLKSRTVRILIPLICCVIFVMPLMMAVQYVDLTQANVSFWSKLKYFYLNPLYVFKNKWPLGGWFWHFWFLQFLIAFIFIFAILRILLFRKSEAPKFFIICNNLLSTHLGFWILILLTYLINLFGPPRFVVPGVAFSLNSLIYFGIFFLFGSMIYYKPKYLEKASNKFSNYLLLFIVSAIVIIQLRAKVLFTSGLEIFKQDWSLFDFNTNSHGVGIWTFPIIDNIYNSSNFFLIDLEWHFYSFLRSFTTWSSMFLIIYYFKKFADKKNNIWQYVSQSSYWVYLIHFPIQHMLFVFVLRNNIQSAIILFILLLTISTLLSFLTYHYFVRSSFIGKILNGRKYAQNNIELKHDIRKLFNLRNIGCITLFSLSLFIVGIYEKNSNSKILNYALLKDYNNLKTAIANNAGITLYSKRSDGRTPLHLVATKVNDLTGNNTNTVVKSIEIIIQDGLNVDVRDNYGNSPLHYAVRSLNYPAIHSLLDNGANPNIKNAVNGSTPLHNAATIGKKKILNYLLTNGANPDITNKYGKKPVNYYTKFNVNLDADLMKKLKPK